MTKKDGSVKVRSIKPTKSHGILQVEFEQEVMRPIYDASSMLNVLMQGHPSFGKPTQIRVAYHNMSSEAIAQFQLQEGGVFPEEWAPRLAVHEFCEGDIIPLSARSFYKGTEIFQPASWEVELAGIVTKVTQQPKRTPIVEGKEQDVLTRNGLPIYRNIYFTLEGMDQNDYLIRHDVTTTIINRNQNNIRSYDVHRVGTAVMP